MLEKTEAGLLALLTEYEQLQEIMEHYDLPPNLPMAKDALQLHNEHNQTDQGVTFGTTLPTVSRSDHETASTCITSACLLTIQTPGYQGLYVTAGSSHGQPLLQLWSTHDTMETEELTAERVSAITAT